MGSTKYNKPRWTAAYNSKSCTLSHQIFTIVLLGFIYLLTNFSLYQDRSSQRLIRINGGYLSWPDRGFGSRLSLKIYVYDEDEIEGLDTLLYGTDLNLTVDDCDKGRWGTQVRSLNIYVSIYCDCAVSLCT